MAAIDREKLRAKLETIPEEDREPYLQALRSAGHTWGPGAAASAAGTPAPRRPYQSESGAVSSVVKDLLWRGLGVTPAMRRGISGEPEPEGANLEAKIENVISRWGPPVAASIIAPGSGLGRAAIAAPGAALRGAVPGLTGKALGGLASLGTRAGISGAGAGLASLGAGPEEAAKTAEAFAKGEAAAGVFGAGVSSLWRGGKRAAQGALELLTEKFSGTPRSAWETLKRFPAEVADWTQRGTTRLSTNEPVPLAFEHARKLEEAAKTGGTRVVDEARVAAEQVKQEAAEQARLALETSRAKSAETLRIGREKAAEVTRLHEARAKEAVQRAKAEAEVPAMRVQERITEASDIAGENYQQMLRQLAAESKSVRLPIDDVVTPAWEKYLAEEGGSVMRTPLTAADKTATKEIKRIYGDIARSAEFGMSPQALATHLQDLTAIQKSYEARASAGVAGALKRILLDAVPPEYGFIKAGRESYRAAKELERGLSQISKADQPAVRILRLLTGGGRTAEAIRRGAARIPGFADDIALIQASVSSGEVAGSALRQAGNAAARRILDASRAAAAASKKAGETTARTVKAVAKPKAERFLTEAKETAQALREAYQPDINIAYAGAEFTPWMGDLPRTGLLGQALHGGLAGLTAVLGSSPRLAMKYHLAGKAAAPVIERGATEMTKGLPALIAAILKKKPKEARRE